MSDKPQAKRPRLDEKSAGGSSSTSPSDAGAAATSTGRSARPVVDPDAELLEADASNGEELVVTDEMKAEEERCACIPDAA